jgi:preprotein translocase subunit YajC
VATSNDEFILPKAFASLHLSAHLLNMDLSNLKVLLALAPPTQPGQQAPPMWTSMVPLVLLIVVFYFALIRPQQKKSKDHAELLKTIRPGDKVVTSGGVVAAVITVKEKTVTIRSGDAKFEVTKGAITEITERNAESSAA